MAKTLGNSELTAAEKKKPYAKYFYRTPTPPDPGTLEKFDTAMDPVHALPLERINDLLDPGYHAVESGWCVLPQGGLYVANHLKMPGVSVEMINWWMAWHSLEDLRYKIWWPPGHFGISISDQDRSKAVDPATPATLKFQGLTHNVMEDVGGPGPEKITIRFLTPDQFGFDMHRFKAPRVGTIVAANGSSQPLNAPAGAPDAPSPAVMLHFIREIAGGIEYRSRFWMGYQIIDRQPVCLLPPGVKIPEMAARGLAIHNVQEYTNLASFLPQIFEEQQGMIP